MAKKAPAPSDIADKFMLRMPDGLRDRIAYAAKANNRSMNSEIVTTLEEKYPDNHARRIREVQAIIETMSPAEREAFSQWQREQRHLFGNPPDREDAD